MHRARCTRSRGSSTVSGDDADVDAVAPVKARRPAAAGRAPAAAATHAKGRVEVNLAWVLRVQSGGMSGCGRPRGARAGASSRAGVGNLAPSRVAANLTEPTRPSAPALHRAALDAPPPSPSTSSRALATSPKVKTPPAPARDEPPAGPIVPRDAPRPEAPPEGTSPPAPPLPARCSSFSARRMGRRAGGGSASDTRFSPTAIQPRRSRHRATARLNLTRGLRSPPI